MWGVLRGNLSQRDRDKLWEDALRNDKMTAAREVLPLLPSAGNFSPQDPVENGEKIVRPDLGHSSQKPRWKVS